MKRCSNSLLTILIFHVLCSTIIAQQKYNFDLEEINTVTKLPLGWTSSFTENQKTGYPVKIDSIERQSGNYALSIEKSTGEGDFGVVSFLIKPTFEGKKITLTGYVKTENITEGYAGLWMRIDGTSGMLEFDNMEDRGIRGTSDWNKYTIELDYDEEDATGIYIGGLLTGNGKMWLDNFQVTVDGGSLAAAPAKKIVNAKAKSDTAFDASSGISSVPLTKQSIQNLTNLGMLWGFLKYHHPAIARGDFNWDAELFRILPKFLEAKNKTDALNILEKWVDILGKPDTCLSCKPIRKDSNVILMPDYGYLFNPGNFNESLVGKLTYIKNNRTHGKNYYIRMIPGIGNPEFKNENPYRQMLFPDAGYRLLALYRYWNMIQYFFPYKHLIGEDWNKLLSEFIPVFVNAKDTTAYHLACLRLIARVKDTHANIWGSNKVISDYTGKYYPPIQTRFIEGKLVVTDFYADTLGIKNKLRKGDLITKLDNIPIEDLIKKWLPITPASNYETQLRDLPLKILRGNTDRIMLEISRDGKLSSVEMERIVPGKLKMQIDYDPAPSDSGYKLINGNIGYIFPGKYHNKQLPAIRQLFKNTKGIVIDMRCYPSEFMPFTFGGYIKPTPGPFVKFTNGSLNEPGLFTMGDLLSNGDKNPDYYKRRVVVIVNAKTQSQAEYTTIAFQSAPNVTVIGSTTAAADGNVSPIYLPGGIYTLISGIGVYYPDGAETQRTGVRIDFPIRPTIKGIREGRDELLEMAIRIIEKDSH